MELQKWDIGERLCRGCLLNLNESSGHNLFPDLAKIFSLCTSLDAHALDDLPKYLCDDCHEKLLDFRKFQELCIESSQRFCESKIANKVLRRRRGRPPKQKKNSSAEEEHDDTTSNCNTSRDDMVISLLDNEVSLHYNNMNMHFEELGLAENDVSDSDFEPGEKKRRSKRSSSVRVLNLTPTSSKRHKRAEFSTDVKTTATTTVFQCDICPTRFFVEHRLIAHKRSHDGLVPYPCTQEGCDKGFNRFHCLSEHLKQHEGTNRWFACQEDGCSKVYKHKPTLVMHLRKCHKKGPELKSHICEICGKLFKSSAILNDHRYTHKDKKDLPYACEELECMRRFSNKEKLKVHRMRHAGIKNFECPFCSMRKTTRNELKIHINYHTLERTWSCRFCTKVCNSAGNLKMHIRTVHERAKDYACSYCDRKFAKPDTRKYHEMTHTGEKPHECLECGKRFTQPAALRTHRKIHLRHRQQQTVCTIRNPDNNVADTATSAAVAVAAEEGIVSLI